MRLLRSVAALFFLSGCRSTVPNPAAASAVHAPIVDGIVDVGGTSLHIHCAGEGTPVVVLESGLGLDGGSWADVQPGIATFTRACVSDRAGMGYSTVAKKPHSNRQMALELYTLLERARLSAPYVLVGHSMGGTNVRLVASEHPSEVEGMVLVDAMGNDHFARYHTMLPEALKADFAKNLLPALHEGLDFDTYVRGNADVTASSRSLGDIPLVVLTHGKGEPPPGVSPELQAQMDRVWLVMQNELAGLSTNSVHVIAARSGHNIQWDAPKLVVAAVQEVVNAARAHRRVSASALLPLAGEGAQSTVP